MPSERRGVRRCSRQDRTCALILVSASLLAAGRNEVNIFPFLPSAGAARRGSPAGGGECISQRLRAHHAATAAGWWRAAAGNATAISSYSVLIPTVVTQRGRLA
jgi:hypothetical protein